LATFRAHRDLLREFAINRDLEHDELSGGEREAVYREFHRTLKGWEEEPEVEEFDPGDGE